MWHENINKLNGKGVKNMKDNKKMGRFIGKKVIAVMVSLIMVLASSFTTYAAESFEEGVPMYLDNVEVLDNGFVCITEEIHDPAYKNSGNSLRSYPEKENTVTFAHKIYGKDDVLIATFYATVTGIYDQANRTSFITNVSGYFTGTLANNFSYRAAYTSELGRANIFYYGEFFGCFTYSIATNGKISNIA